MKLSSPSFKLKNSDQVIFSSSGNLLTQKGMSGTKVSIWNIENRKLIAQHKIISNGDGVGFLADEQIMFIKNKNGELAFFKTISGELVSGTGKSPFYGAGSKAIFSEIDNLLYDGSWNGELMAWSINPLEKIFSHTYENHMITIMSRNYSNEQFYVVVNPTVNAPMFGGSKLLTFSSLGDRYDPDWILPIEPELMDTYGNWKPIEAMEFNATLILGLKLEGQVEPPIIVNFDVKSNNKKFTFLESQYQSVWSITSNDAVIISAVKTTTYRNGMTSQEHDEARKGIETDHLYIHDKHSLQLIDKVFWPEINCVCFSPDGNALAIASYSKSAYIANYRDLSYKLTNIFDESP